MADFISKEKEIDEGGKCKEFKEQNLRFPTSCNDKMFSLKNIYIYMCKALLNLKEYYLEY